MNSKPQSEKNVVLANHTQEIYAGPVPHPEILKGFQSIDPSFPERIMKMAEANNTAEINRAEKTLSKNFVLAILSQILTFLLGFAGIGAGIFLAIKGFEAGAVAAILAGFAPIVIAAIKTIGK